MDITGRKIPVIVGLMITGIVLILMTRFDQVYPTLVLLSCTVSVSILPAYISPFILDYVTTDSLGPAVAWNSLVGLAGSATATSGIIKLQEYYSIDIIFDSAGCFTIACVMVLMCGLREMTRKKQQENKKGQLKTAFRQLWSRLKAEKGISVSVLGNAATTMTLIAMY